MNNSTTGLTDLIQLNYKKGIHYPSLDGLRGLAVLLVFVFHTMSYVQIFRLGWIGVDLFFVLSGFLITGILVDSKDKPGYYKNFISRRALRIFPLYFFFIILILIVLPAIFPAIFTGLDYYKQHQGWYWLYISNWLPLSTASGTSTLLDHLWSLSIEEQFYIFWPFIVLIASAKNLIRISLVLISGAVFIRYFGSSLLGNVRVFEYYNTFARVDSLLIGALVALLYRMKPIVLIKLALPLLLVSTLIIFIIIIMRKKLDFANLIDSFSLWDVFFAAVLVFAISQRNNWLKSILNTKILKFFGKYSYGIYVYHQPVYKLMFDKVIGPYKVHFTYLPGTATAICLILTILTALLSYNILEKPFLQLKVYFEPARNQLVKQQ